MIPDYWEAEKSAIELEKEFEKNNRDLLAKWEGKLKIAQNMIKKYREKVRYYERKRAANAAPKCPQPFVSTSP